MELSWQELLKPSIIDGALSLHREERSRPGAARDEVIRLLCSTYASSGYDFANASTLLELVPNVSAASRFYRDVFFTILQKRRPAALMLLLQGRDAFCGALDADALESFRRAEALDPTPSLEVVAWLDSLAALSRSMEDSQKLDAGRQAERRTLAWECARLASLGVTRTPVWTSLNDNAAGYDIYSWDEVGANLRPRLIEVKSHAGATPQFFLTRNEMRVARRSAGTYFIYLWALNASQPIVIAWPELEPRLPPDTAQAQCWEVLVRWEDRRVE